MWTRSRSEIPKPALRTVDIHSAAKSPVSKPSRGRTASTAAGGTTHAPAGGVVPVPPDLFHAGRFREEHHRQRGHHFGGQGVLGLPRLLPGVRRAEMARASGVFGAAVVVAPDQSMNGDPAGD